MFYRPLLCSAVIHICDDGMVVSILLNFSCSEPPKVKEYLLLRWKEEDMSKHELPSAERLL